MNVSIPNDTAEEVKRLLHLVDSGGILGATRQLGIIGDCLVTLARSGAPDSSLREAANSLVRHIAETRGQSSQAVLNGTKIMAAPALDLTTHTLSVSVESAVDSFLGSMLGWMSSLHAYSAKLLFPYTTFLAYDYSSTVSFAMADLRRAGKDVIVYVPEARSLGGGAKYLGDWEDTGITVHLIPDASLGWALDKCDAALVGAETFSTEGGCYNTIGSKLAASEAQRSRVPFYVLSILLKTDLETMGGEKSIPSLDFTSSAFFDAKPMVRGASIHGNFPDLDYTPPGLITAIVTEQGILQPQEIAGAFRSLDMVGGATRG